MLSIPIAVRFGLNRWILAAGSFALAGILYQTFVHSAVRLPQFGSGDHLGIVAIGAAAMVIASHFWLHRVLTRSSAPYKRQPPTAWGGQG